MKKIKLRKKRNAKKIFKPNKATIIIKEHKPAEYVNRFFKEEVEDAEMALFFK